jgi:hypothetical protein
MCTLPSSNLALKTRPMVPWPTSLVELKLPVASWRSERGYDVAVIGSVLLFEWYLTANSLTLASVDDRRGSIGGGFIMPNEEED